MGKNSHIHPKSKVANHLQVVVIHWDHGRNQCAREVSKQHEIISLANNQSIWEDLVSSKAIHALKGIVHSH